jgi:hypothetical protein
MRDPAIFIVVRRCLERELYLADVRLPVLLASIALACRNHDLVEYGVGGEARTIFTSITR